MENIQRVRIITERLAEAVGISPPFDRVFEVLEQEGVLEAFEKAERLDRKLEQNRVASSRYRSGQKEN